MDIQELYDKIYTYLRARRSDIIFNIILTVLLSVVLYHRHAKTNSKVSTTALLSRFSTKFLCLALPHTLFC